MKYIFLFTLALFTTTLFGQVTIKVSVKTIEVTNTQDCDAGVSDDSDYLFEFKADDNSPASNSNNNPIAGSIGLCNYALVNNNNGPFTLSPSAPGTATFFPSNGLFFNYNYNCKQDVPTQLSITWTAYENDDITTPSTTPIANGTISPQIYTYTVPTSNGTYSIQYSQTSSDGSCAQSYIIEFEVEKSIGSFTPLTVVQPEEHIICAGSSSGTLEGVSNGGSGTITYDWSYDGQGDFDDNANENNISGGTYTLVVKDALGCTDTTTAEIIEVTVPQAISGFTLSTDSVCTNQNGVSYAVSPAQLGTAFYWSFSGSGANINNTLNTANIDFLNFATSGILSVYGQNACSSTNTITMSINVQTSPNIIFSGNNTMCANSNEIISVSGANTYTWSTGENTSSITISPSSTTIYTVTGTGNNGCSTSKTYTINTIPSPTLQITGSTVAVCPSNTVAVTVSSNGAGYFWSDGFVGNSHTVSANATTIYTVTTTFTNSCYSQATYTLNVLPKPNLSITGGTIVCEGNSTTLTANGADTYQWSNSITTQANIITPITSGTIGLTGTLSNGCKDSIVTSINVVSTPTVYITGDDTICEGKNATLYANSTGIVTYGWNNGANTSSITVTPLGTFTYVVTVDNGGCTASASQELIVNLIPTVDFALTNTLVCTTDGIITFTANPSGGTYTGTGVTGDTFDPSIGAGIYPILYEVTTSNNCLASATQTIQVDLCTGISNISNDNEVSFYPNPFNSYINLKSFISFKSIAIYDCYGKLVRIIESTNNELLINTSEFERGFYTCTILFSNNTKKSIKLIKE
jgi:hypothetical protein